MSEWVNEGWEYDAAPGTVFRMITRLDHLTEQAAYQGYRGFAVRELRERDGLFRVSAERLLPGVRRGRPALVHSTQQWQQPAWDGTRRFDLTARVDGSTLTVSGQGQLQPAGIRGTRYSMRLRVQSGARFFARQTERDAADQLSAVLAGEHTFRGLWLNGRDTAHFRLTA